MSRLVAVVAALLGLLVAGCATTSPTAGHSTAMSGTPHRSSSANGPGASWRTLAHCPPGQRLGLVAYARSGALHLLDLNRCRQRVLVAHGARSPVAFSANGRWLAFGLQQPKLIAVNGRHRPVRAFAQRVTSAWAWSPHGAALAAVGYDQGLRVRRPGRPEHTLLSAHFGARSFVWARSGRKLEVGRDLYRERGAQASRRDVQQLLSVPVDGGRPRLLYRTPHGIAAPVPAGFSPDGRWAFFWPDTENSASIAADGLPLRVISTHGGQALTVLRSMLTDPGWLTFCAGRAVIVAGGIRFTLYHKRLVTARAPGWRPGKLTSDRPLSWVAPACAPDGRRLAAAAGPAQPDFHRLDTQHRSLWLLNPRTGARHRLTRTPPGARSSDDDPHWTADGRYILFDRQGRTRGEHGDRYDLMLVRVSDHRVLGPLAQIGPSVNETIYAPRAFTTAAAPSPPACSTHDLHIRPVINGGAAGTRLIALSYRNLTRATCTMTGYPSVTLYGAGGQIVVARRRTGRRVRTLELKPGDRVYGGISYGETPVPENEHCPAVTSLRISVPNSRQATRVAIHNAGQFCAGALVGPVATGAKKSLIP